MPAPHPSRISQVLLQVATWVCLGISVCFWFLYFSLYWPYRNRFNDEGRYFDEGTSAVYHAQSSWLLLPALAFLLLAVGVGTVWRMRRCTGRSAER